MNLLKISIFLSILLMLSPKKVEAFDRIYCQSDLKGWILTLTDSTSTAVMTPYNQSVTLPEQVSQKLILKDSNANTVITIFPWNSLYVRIPDNIKKSYKIDTKESPAGFVIDVTDKSTQVSRSLNCGFTF